MVLALGRAMLNHPGPLHPGFPPARNDALGGDGWSAGFAGPAERVDSHSSNPRPFRLPGWLRQVELIRGSDAP